MSFKNAVLNTPSIGRTANGMKTYTDSLDANVDLFYQIGSSRGKDVTNQFERAYQNDRVVALRTLAWARDVRGGAGERETFRNLLKYVEKNHAGELAQMIKITPIVGRWDDLLVLESNLGKDLAYSMIKHALLVEGNGLCAKWMPRKGNTAVALTRALGLTPKGYRKTLVGLTKVVESQMCAKQWTQINYSHVPSVAAGRYSKAFGRHDEAGYNAYKAKLVTGEAKINAQAVYPYNVINTLKRGDSDIAVAQWDALPNYIGDELVLPMVDVSGSMSCAVGGTPGLSCMDVAISLGLYLADKNTGPFKDMFLTFSERSKIEVLKGNLRDKYNQLSHAQWGMSTNLHAAFDEVLRVAKAGKVAPDWMPKYILILSDMEFNSCTKYDDSAIEMIRRKYEDAGYEVPSIIFWNLHARPGNSPVTADEQGTALVSGFSPAIMTAVLRAENVTPVDIMLQAVNDVRYAGIV
jgi:hypothetical protein